MLLFGAFLIWCVAHFLFGITTDPYLCAWIALVMFFIFEYLDPWETIQRGDEVIVFYPSVASFDNADQNLIISVHGSIFHPKATTR